MANDTALAIAAGLLGGLNRGMERRRQRETEEERMALYKKQIEASIANMEARQKEAELRLQWAQEERAAAVAAGATPEVLARLDLQIKQAEAARNIAEQTVSEFKAAHMEEDYQEEKMDRALDREYRQTQINSAKGLYDRSGGYGGSGGGGNGGGSGSGGEGGADVSGEISTGLARSIGLIQERMNDYMTKHMIVDEMGNPKGWDSEVSKKTYEQMERDLAEFLKQNAPGLPQTQEYKPPQEYGPTTPAGYKSPGSTMPWESGGWTQIKDFAGVTGGESPLEHAGKIGKYLFTTDPMIMRKIGSTIGNFGLQHKNGISKIPLLTNPNALVAPNVLDGIVQQYVGTPNTSNKPSFLDSLVKSFAIPGAVQWKP